MAADPFCPSNVFWLYIGCPGGGALGVTSPESIYIRRWFLEVSLLSDRLKMVMVSISKKNGIGTVYKLHAPAAVH